jgi:hypothetical protein
MRPLLGALSFFVVMAGPDPAIQQNKRSFRRADARRLDGRL